MASGAVLSNFTAPVAWGTGFATLPAAQVVALGVAYFGLLYFVTGGVTWLLTRRVLPALGWGRLLDPRALAPGQVRREMSESVVSVLIFGVGLLLPWALLQVGWAQLAAQASPMRVAIEIAVLFLWNELHFYVNHRMLHAPLLRRFHGDHHRSQVATPWSTYALHPVEALLLGSVPIVPMLLHDFTFPALVCLPVFSIMLNNLGHSNYEFSRTPSAHGWLGASRRHHLHHACYNGNYGFLLEVFDRWAGSVLPPDSADARIRAGRDSDAPATTRAR
ncbi:sterol desaturase family protein [Agrilutibacter solisilvae]|uniref:Sterol desaturase family protein n=1 Tax=Agrilutibacter solisilvae TaxID=2763317 RepID=A0A974Y3J7_9GAMM|nr:sterol desaturase family protein [Lysobacter solisilvae]QSX77161.1 sterol desaturase family protein [Lysobacter solisilvae]